jgi:glycerate 2-kinase
VSETLHRSHLRKIFDAAIAAVDPTRAVEQSLDHVRAVFQKGGFRKLLIIGFGKASHAMAAPSEEHLCDLLADGVIVTKHGHTTAQTPFSKIRVYEAGHPLPDPQGIEATNEIISVAREADEKTLILSLISGGGSALLVSPHELITLREKQVVTNLLLRAGATITELNAVRKHISRVKGGRFAEIAYPARTISLIVSDVVGDRFDVIASGPTSPDDSTYEEALGVLQRYHLSKDTPLSVVGLLEKGERGLFPETPKEGDDVFDRVENRIIASNRLALEAAKQQAEKLGYSAQILSSALQGEAREVAKWLAARGMTQGLPRPFCLISGGETTVRVRGSGLGGRNTELALAFAVEIEGMPGTLLLSAGTDGTDGPTDAAGAIVDSQTVARGRSLSLDPAAFLTNNDSYTFLRKTGDLLKTGPTGTNVMDIQVIMGT